MALHPYGAVILDTKYGRNHPHEIRAMHSLIRPNTHVALRLPSGLFKILEITPNTYVA